MRPAALSALCLVLLLLPLLDARGSRRPGVPGTPRPVAPSAPAAPPADQRRRKSPAGRPPKVARPSACGEACCPGWSVAPKTGKCTKVICTPRCQNGGQCQAPQRCSCRPGFGGLRCEHARPPPTLTPQPQPSLAVRWQPLTLSELQVVLRRRKALGPTEKMATILAQHLASRRGSGPSASPTQSPHDDVRI